MPGEAIRETRQIGTQGLHSSMESADGRSVIPRLERTVTLLMLGRLRHRGSDTICRIRNVSAGGMRIDTGTPLHKGVPVSIEARSGVSIEGHVAWTSQLASGIAFARNVDHLELLAPPTGPSGARMAVRSPRFSATARARLDIGGRSLELRLVDISLGGCRVECEANLPREVVGGLTIMGLPPLACSSRWVKGNAAGLIFPTRLDFASFACWLERTEFRFGSAPALQNAAQDCALGAPVRMPFSRPRSS